MFPNITKNSDSMINREHKDYAYISNKRRKIDENRYEENSYIGNTYSVKFVRRNSNFNM